MTQCDHCPAEAAIVTPGSAPVYELFLLVRGEPARAWCLACAKRAGWPWLASEKPRKTRAPWHEGEP